MIVFATCCSLVVCCNKRRWVKSTTYQGSAMQLDQARGIAIYYPSQASARTYQTYIQGDLIFPDDTLWDEFLAAGLAALPFDPSAPEPHPVAPLPFARYTIYLPVVRR